MAYFGKYIRQILSRQEAVIFPGFGSLIVKESAGIEAIDGQIDPPGAVIKFDPTHPKDDQKLSAEYAQGEGLSEEEAQQQLLELVDAIKFKLDKGEVYDLTLVGKFSRDDDNRIHFQKDPNWVIDPELFGLGTLDLLELDNEEAKDAVPTDIKSKQPKTEIKEPIKKETEVKSARKPTNKWKIIWIVIGSLIVVLVLILLIPAGDENNAIEFGKDGIMIRNTDQATTPVDPRESTKRVRHSDKTEAVDQPASPQKPEVDTSQPVVSENAYFIIAGSFQNLQNASELLENLKSQGFPAEIVYTENRMYRVAVKSYSTKDAAIKDLGGLKAMKGLENVWVWTK